MLNKLTIRNFKLFDDVEIELAERVVFVGPNNSGKTSALQALALWSIGVRRWLEKRGEGNVPKDRSAVTINRRDLVAVPVPSAKLLWRNLHVRQGYKVDNQSKTKNVLFEISVEGVDQGSIWNASMEFDYANEESIYCRSTLNERDERSVVPPAAGAVKLAFLPPMSGIASNETRLDEGAIDVRIGEGRTAEVLRNLCWNALQASPERWQSIVERMRKLFGVTIQDPRYIKERGEIVMAYTTKDDFELDLSASGRGQQQTLLLLAHLATNPGTVLLLDEPDAHLEILRQRQIYNALTETAREANSQIIAASHSEVILNEAADRDTVIAFLGQPHRIDDRSNSSQVAKSLKSIGFEQYLQAETTGWVIYLEGSTDLAILQAFARQLNHPALEVLERPFAHYVANQPSKAREHFYALREAKPDLVGFALLDRLDMDLKPEPSFVQRMLTRREIENYLLDHQTLTQWAKDEGARREGDLFATSWETLMTNLIEEFDRALKTLSRPDSQSPEIKATDEFLDPLFKKLYESKGLPLLMRKTDYHVLVPFVPRDKIDPEIVQFLNQLVDIASQAKPRGASS
jgi:energy-coupling factor transporter ATP-binding protein EcfA2